MNPPPEHTRGAMLDWVSLHLYYSPGAGGQKQHLANSRCLTNTCKMTDLNMGCVGEKLAMLAYVTNLSEQICSPLSHDKHFFPHIMLQYKQKKTKP